MKGIIYHNVLSDKIEYYVTVVGYNISNIVFYEKIRRGEREEDHFFAAGSEILFTEEGIMYDGTGGGLCEYMFGVDQPLPDLLRREILNRLVIFGAFHSMLYDKIIFTDEVRGFLTYDEIFLKGHAINNYYFFILSKFKESIKARQEIICRKLGKILKRTPLVGQCADEELANEILTNMGERKVTVILVRIKNIHNETYYKKFKEFYDKKKHLTEDEKELLNNFAESHQIVQYQRERMQIDVIYKHKEHRHIVDEYKDILIQGQGKRLSDFQKARLKRLRALSMRNEIPSSLFDTLDELLLESKEDVEIYEPDYIRESRIILESIFIHSEEIEVQVTNEDVKKLLFSKKKAVQLRDTSFEELLLEIGRLCDEILRDKEDARPLENFSYIIAYFDRFDSCADFINKIAFMQNIEISDATVRSLYGSMVEFNKISEDLFFELFVDDLLEDKYLTRYGRKKILCLVNGFKKVVKNELSLPDLIKELNGIAMEESLYVAIHSYLLGRIKNYYWDLASKREIETLRGEAIDYLNTQSRRYDAQLLPLVFDKVVFDLKKESYYLRNILPKVIRNNDVKLREDFIVNSGIDRFIIEELEKDYLTELEADKGIIEKFQEESQRDNNKM